MTKPTIIPGKYHQDKRGKIIFVNDFQLDNIKRFYIIKNEKEHIIRAWQGHKIESKRFFVIQGKYKIILLKPDNWGFVSKDLRPEVYVLDSTKPCILNVPKGYINGIESMENNSILLVFSDFDLDASKSDDYRWNVDYFKVSDEVFNEK